MAAQNAIQNPLLDETSLKGAKAVLVNVTGGMDMTLLEVDEAANAISAEVDPEANIIFGAAFDPSLEGKIRVSVVATGMDSAAMQKAAPQAASTTTRAIGSAPLRQPEPARQPEPVRAPEPVRPAATTFGARPAAPQAAPAAPAASTFGRAAEPETVRSFDPEKHTLTGGRRVDIREPRVEEVRASVDEAPIARIVDPLVEDDEAELQGDLYLDTPVAEPMITQPRGYAPRAPEPRAEARPAVQDVPPAYAEEKKGGWRSLFGGRPRYDAQSGGRGPQASYAGGRGQPQLRTTQQAQVQVEPETQADAQDDLEIPSFLRRLAN
jgi:cell division protein FtsZ